LQEEAAKTEDLQPAPEFSLESSFKLKSTWLVIIGAFMVALSPFLNWVTATISIPPWISQSITITGYDATWNLTFSPLITLRMIYFQFTSLALALIALLLRIFFPSETPKWIRSTMLMTSGILGVTVPAYFIYVSISQVQQLSSQFRWIIDFLKTLNMQLQYNLSVGPGLILAIAGPILLLISGVFALREKT